MANDTSLQSSSTRRNVSQTWHASVTLVTPSMRCLQTFCRFSYKTAVVTSVKSLETPMKRPPEEGIKRKTVRKETLRKPVAEKDGFAPFIVQGFIPLSTGGKYSSEVRTH
jgi:hypothetical protein